MSLQIKGWRRAVEWALIVLVAIFTFVFIVRVLVWENEYYNQKEGSERASAVKVAEAEPEEELVEVEPTVEEVREYTVAADRPRYLSVSRLGVSNARILAVGIKQNGELGTPYNIFDVGWYDASGKPGEGKTILIDGHNGGPHVHGVFKDLPILQAGDIVSIERGDGTIFKYRVVENVEVSINDSDEYMKTAMKTPEAGKESLTLISCTGDWSSARQTYLSRQFVRAVLV